MCGIAGICESGLPAEEVAQRLRKMMDAQLHRGPDESGIKLFPQARAAIGCQRLSLVDIENGQQPMSNEGETVFVVFNGEIYNHTSLRNELEKKGHRFRSRSDTEVIIHLYEEYGDACLEMLNGMFGLAIFDARTRRLLLGRDRSGMKPLYYAQNPHGFLFASEIKALLASGLVTTAPDAEAIDTFLSVGWVPAPRTGFRGIEKLPPGGFLVIEGSRVQRGTFWQPRFLPESEGRKDREHAEELEQRLRSAVTSHLAADVPVGCFISGGWDSSLIAAIAAQQSNSRLKTFSIVFPDHPKCDESRYSRQLVSYLDSEHHEIEFRDAQIPDLLPRTIRSLEEPNAATPSMLIYQLTSLAAASVKTVMSGEGSDELFAGYSWLDATNHYRLRRVVPARLAGFLERRSTSMRWRRLFRIIAAADDVHADIEWFRRLTPTEKQHSISPNFRADSENLSSALPPAGFLASSKDRLERQLCLEFTGRLPACLLQQGDKLGMAHSLEVRLPFLDCAVIDFALGLPSRMKMNGSREKYVLSFLAHSLLPAEIATRRKQGLAYPDAVFASPHVLRFARETLLDSADPDGPVNRDYLEKLWPRWLAREELPLRMLGPALVLQIWWNEFFG